jgi:hypothetical protein
MTSHHTKWSATTLRLGNWPRLERSGRPRHYSKYAAWHKKCFGWVIEILLALLSIFGAGFGAGYGLREAISRRRRREYRRSMA